MEWLDFGVRMYDGQIGWWHSQDELCEKWISVSPYTYALNTPINAIDPNGKDVYFILSTNAGGDMADAAKTRESEIKNSKGFNKETDHVYVLYMDDLSKIKEQVSNSLKDADKNGYGLTKEISFFSHGGINGPVGGEKTSKHNLSAVTGKPSDYLQMSPEGWKEIDFNFDPNGSVAAF